MPTSHPLLLTPIAQEILSLQPKTVLDIGIGFGKWGALTREYTDVWCQRKTSSTIIHGIEVFESYKSPNWQHYNKIFIGNALELLPTVNSYDLIIFLEVLEHIEKTKALEFLNICRTKCKTLLFSFTNSPQGDAFGNSYERHISTWEDKDFVFEKKLLATNGTTFVYKSIGVK